jgi:hypothetical protein
MVIKINLPDYRFEEVCRFAIANLLTLHKKVSKKAIIERLRHLIYQSGEYYINFPDDADSEAAEYLDDNYEKVNSIYDRYFK